MRRYINFWFKGEEVDCFMLVFWFKFYILDSLLEKSDMEDCWVEVMYVCLVIDKEYFVFRFVVGFFVFCVRIDC